MTWPATPPPGFGISERATHRAKAERPKVIVYHADYGCETGCCGHIVAMGDREDFHFDHPYGETDETALKEWARQLVIDTFGAEHAADLDWDNCHVTDC